MFITDLGLDRVYSYHFDAARRRSRLSIRLMWRPMPGPVRAASRCRRTASSSMSITRRIPKSASIPSMAARLKEIQVIGTVPPDAKAHNTTAELVISADGKFLYVGNRGHDSVSVFAIDRKTGMLTLERECSLGRQTPRNVRIDPTGNWFFAANENGGNVTEFRIDRASGHLTPTGVTAPIDTPGGIYFLKVK